MEEEGTLGRADNLKHAGNPSPSKSSPYSLYFKGLVSEETTELSAEFRVAICGYKDGLMFQMKGPIHDSLITLLEAELMALKCGLSEAVSLGINHISICCDNNQIFEWVMGRSVPQQENIALLIRDVQGIRKRFTSSIAVRVTRNQVEFAYKVGMEAICSKTKIAMPTLFHPGKIDVPALFHPKMTCSICFDDDINADQMFSVDICCHVFCSECVRRHIEVRLAGGYSVTCPQYRCKSKLTYGRCVNILTPKLKEMWEQRIREDAIHVTDRVYCPNPTCSALMSLTELYQLTGSKRCCVKCGEPFCIKCKVPWHNNLSCKRYKELHSNRATNDNKLTQLANQKSWRQCSKCKQMIELSEGCVHVICRCGHEFCYGCGADAGSCSHGHAYYFSYEDLEPEVLGLMLVSIVAVIMIFFIR
ncbi:unnamed protein product [Arabidopsis lyrata]|nr:probable E3 ubiquitin-protein ligase RNF217 [Arabidopsis lyrata subsp. lyrata]CAH8263642.1 unnamed protein product [Arabidopsis lyrata]|eukprot:XP_002878927.2 probable E3 ubiquitin-protein ligase RNF217 [Arabidopsis lyrata subsp. lyrata]